MPKPTGSLSSSPFAPSPDRPELLELRRKQATIKVCKPKKKHEVNSTSNRVTMWKEFLDSENGDPNLVRQKTLQSLKSPTALKRVWANEAVKLNEMFDNIDKFDMSEEPIEDEEDSGALAVRPDDRTQTGTGQDMLDHVAEMTSSESSWWRFHCFGEEGRSDLLGLWWNINMGSKKRKFDGLEEPADTCEIQGGEWDLDLLGLDEQQIDVDLQEALDNFDKDFSTEYIQPHDPSDDQSNPVLEQDRVVTISLVTECDSLGSVTVAAIQELTLFLDFVSKVLKFANDRHLEGIIPQTRLKKVLNQLQNDGPAEEEPWRIFTPGVGSVGMQIVAGKRYLNGQLIWFFWLRHPFYRSKELWYSSTRETKIGKEVWRLTLSVKGTESAGQMRTEIYIFMDFDFRCILDWLRQEDHRPFEYAGKIQPMMVHSWHPKGQTKIISADDTERLPRVATFELLQADGLCAVQLKFEIQNTEHNQGILQKCLEISGSIVGYKAGELQVIRVQEGCILVTLLINTKDTKKFVRFIVLLKNLVGRTEHTIKLRRVQVYRTPALSYLKEMSTGSDDSQVHETSDEYSEAPIGSPASASASVLESIETELPPSEATVVLEMEETRMPPRDVVNRLQGIIGLSTDEVKIAREVEEHQASPNQALTMLADDTKTVARYCQKAKPGSSVRFWYIAKNIILRVNHLTPGAYLIAELYPDDKKTSTRLNDYEQKMLIFRTPCETMFEEDEVLRYDQFAVYIRRHTPSEDGTFKLGFGMLSPTSFFGMEDKDDRQLFIRCTVYHSEGEIQSYNGRPFCALENSKRRKSHTLMTHSSAHKQGRVCDMPQHLEPAPITQNSHKITRTHEESVKPSLSIPTAEKDYVEKSLFDRDNLRFKDQMYRPSGDIWAVQEEIRPDSRAILIDWLYEFSEGHHLQTETAMMAINYIDRFMAIKRISLDQFQLLGFTALRLAAKMQESELISLWYIDDISPGDVIEMEMCLLFTLSWNLCPPTSITWLRMFLDSSQRDDAEFPHSTLTRTTLSIQHLLMLPDSLTFSAGLIAASAFWLYSPISVNNEDFENITGFSVEETGPIVQLLNQMQGIVIQPDVQTKLMERIANKGDVQVWDPSALNYIKELLSDRQ
ncbi:G1/S-specific cyclin-E2-like [Planoprotostelium fungivorum]|uniref:G1/S-specific cyclin-E2-like n=1 Tax=Planoprotostelium fungivorum TaxID=1890364 RepID=A0A2P6NZF4_9EUKA|nr:G1/S-specific cyclin-E2-like [Planoprotostelium fungivorum]